MENNNKNWLVLEPTIDITIIDDDIFLYDSIQKINIERRGAGQEIITIFSSLIRNNNIIEYNHDVKKKRVYSFINLLRQKYFIDLIPVNHGDIRPIQLTNIVNIQNDKEKIIWDASGSRSIGDNIMTYLNEISICLNSNEKEIMPNASRQFLFNHPLAGEKDIELDFEVLLDFLSLSKINSLRRVNILGEKILEYSKFVKLLKYLIDFNLYTNLVFYLDVLYDQIPEVIKVLKSFANKIVLTVVVRMNSFNDKSFDEVKMILSDFNLHFNFVIESIDGYKKYEKLSVDSFSYSLTPYYTGNNLSFFKDNIFITREDFNESNLDLKTLNINKTLNPNFFGRLTIVSNGDVYANLNAKKNGTIFSNTLAECIVKEFKMNENSWFAVKSKLSPCSGCIYKSVCPPISNYELFFKKNNLCLLEN